MARVPRLIPWIVLSIVLALVDASYAGASRFLVATLQRVVDGDSVTALSDNGTKFRLRLLGIDAPEIAHDRKPGQPYGEEAHDHLDHLADGKTIRVDRCGPEKYVRMSYRGTQERHGTSPT